MRVVQVVNAIRLNELKQSTLLSCISCREGAFSSDTTRGTGEMASHWRQLELESRVVERGRFE